MARKKKHDDHGGGGGGGHGGASGRWLVSYSDFITLLMVVFLVLFSFSRLDVAKYQTLAQSLRGSLGGAGGMGVAPFPTSGGSGTPTPVAPSGESGAATDLPDWPAHLIVPPIAAPGTNTTTPQESPATGSGSNAATSAPPARPVDSMQGVADVFKSLPGSTSGLMSVALEERGVVLSLAGSVLFAPGQVELKPEASSYLGSVAESLRGIELPIMVTGTADPGYQPGADGLPSYKVASLRTSAVIDYFVKQQGLSAASFVFFGSGDSVGDDGRVSIVVLRKAE